MTVEERREQQALKVTELTSDYIHLVPEYLRDNESFLVFFALLCNEFGITLKNIENFTDIINSDKTPRKFLEFLGAFVNYHYQDRGTEEFNRELLLSQNTIWKQRGTDHSIIMAATYGDCEGYVGGDIFIPGYDLDYEIAEIVVTKDKLFIHDKSNHSSDHVFSDADLYRPGIIEISLNSITDNIRHKILEVLPAGIKVAFRVITTFYPTEGAVRGEHNELTWKPYFRVVPLTEKGDASDSENNAINLLYEVNMKLVEDRPDILTMSDRRRGYGKKHSGRLQITREQVNEHSLGVSCLPMSVLRRKFPLSSMPQTFIETKVSDIKDIYLVNDADIDIPNVLKDRTRISLIGEDFNGDEYELEAQGYYIIGNDETTSLPYRHNTEGSVMSGSGRLSGKVSDLTEGVIQEIRPDSDAVKEPEDMTPDEREQYERDSLFYTISRTGEYIDRVDKLTSDSVIRKIDTKPEFETKTKYNITLTHSSRLRSGAFSGRASHSGIFTGTYDAKVNILPISPFDVLYPISEVDDIKPDGYRSPFFSYGFDSSKDVDIETASAEVKVQVDKELDYSISEVNMRSREEIDGLMVKHNNTKHSSKTEFSVKKLSDDCIIDITYESV